MKWIVTLVMITTFSVPAFAKPGKVRKPNSNENVDVRCEGVNAAGARIGLDVELDQVDRLVSLTSFEKEGTAPIDLAGLASPSHYFRADRSGNLVVFGFKTFNDGLEEDMSVLFVAAAPKLSALKLGQGANNLAVKNVSCRVLK